MEIAVQTKLRDVAREQLDTALERGSVTRSNARQPAARTISAAHSDIELPRVTDPRSVSAFTLIELMLVMALLTVVISLVTPSLIKFFGGRALDSEVRQIISLTRYGQSRAVSEGIPTVLWVNPGTGTYGLRQETGYVETDPKALDFRIADGLQLGVDYGKSQTQSKSPDKLLGIHFSPEGNIITAASVAGISVRELNRPPLWIVPAFNGLSYEVRH